MSTDGRDESTIVSKVSAEPVPRGGRSEGEILESSNLKSFPLSELKAATRNFRPDSVLGEGGFGSVYKGCIDEHSLVAAKPDTGIMVAVKRLNPDSIQGHNEWLVSRTKSIYFESSAIVNNSRSNEVRRDGKVICFVFCFRLK